MRLPALRPVDLVPIEYEGEQLICMSDPTQLVEEQLLLSPGAAFVASLLDGRHGVEDIQGVFREYAGGAELPAETIFSVVHHLDERGFLYTDSFEVIFQRAREEFGRAAVRPAFLAGRSYPDDPDTLRAFLDEQFLRDGGPGTRPNGKAKRSGHLRGLIVPHIDFHRGGHTYAHGYLRLSDHEAPDTVFVFGVAHAAEPVPFILTRKDFDTPLGMVKADTAMLDRIEKACAWDPYTHELTHRTEHSVEFQAVMLAHLFGEHVKIVPVLCSMFGENFHTSAEEEKAPITRFLAACRECVQDGGKRVAVIASADLAHVGRRFGDGFEIDESVVSAVRLRDEEDLVHAHAIAPEDFYASVMRDRNERKVCGLNCIYATLKALDGSATRGEPLHYDYAHDPAGGIVSFASIALY